MNTIAEELSQRLHMLKDVVFKLIFSRDRKVEQKLTEILHKNVGLKILSELHP